MFVLYCFVFKEKGPTLIAGYKTKAAAIRRAKKAVESGCYEKVEVIEMGD
jgi:hypothetical protein